jgi:hypothetical protein
LKEEDGSGQSVPGDTAKLFGDDHNKRMVKQLKACNDYVRPQQQSPERLLPLIQMYARGSVKQAHTRHNEHVRT